jgi:hypothetical protein
MATRDVVQEIRRASRPHGATTGDELQLTARQRQYACNNGLLARIYPGVYIDPGSPSTPERALAAAIFAARPMAAAWGPSATALWYLTDEHPDSPHIVIPRTQRSRVPGAVVRRSSAWSFDDMTYRNGILVTKPLLAVIDYAVEHDPMQVAEVIVTARQKKLFEPAAVQAEVARRARPGRTGIRTARMGLQLVMIGDRPADSILELRFHHGPGKLLPAYEYQYPVKLGAKKYRIDFAYPSVKLAIEVLGYDSRKSRQQLDYEAERTRALIRAGWTVLPATWTQVVYDPNRVASDVLGCLGTLGYTFCS